jgi:hypothetical protein
MSSVSQVGQKLCHFFKDNMCPKYFFTTSDVCSQKSNSHKAVKFGRITRLHWDYSLTKNHSILMGLGCDLCGFGME